MKRVVWLLTCLFIALQIHATTIKVCESCPIQSITIAIKEASAGDTILITSNTYKEPTLVVDKALTLIGEGYPVLDGQGENELIRVTADSVSIFGLSLTGVHTSYIEDRAGLRIQRAKHFVIEDNEFKNTFFAIYLEHAKNGVVRNNRISGNAIQEMSSGNGIHCWYSKNILIEDNYIKGQRDGIYFEFVDSSLIRNNVSEQNIRYGLHFMFSNYDNYYNNTFRNNGAGVAVMFSKYIHMWDNHFDANWGRSSYGLLLKEIYDADIKNNMFSGNTIAIYAEGSSRINLTSNEFRRNGWAIKITGGCLDLNITQNNFIVNTFDLAVHSSGKTNNFDGNFWSEYQGYDLDQDGFGDIPFRPVKLFNYIVNKTPESIVLLRSLFVDLLNFSEKVSPALTPENVLDKRPSMKEFDLGLSMNN